MTAQNDLPIIDFGKRMPHCEDLGKVCDDQTQNNFLSTRLAEFSLKIPMIRRLHCHMIFLKWNKSVVTVLPGF